MKDTIELERIVGSPLKSLCDPFVAQRPPWVEGSLSGWDSRFLFESVLRSGASVAVEIGTATGFSAALLCHALDVASRAGLIGAEFQVVSYDVNTKWHRDQTKTIGDAARLQLPRRLLDRVLFRNPAKAVDARRDFATRPVEFLFIDASHQHPWPALDLLAMVDCLAPGATVVLHDINLPLLHPQYADWGAKYLFDDLAAVEKAVSQDPRLPNVGSIRVPDDAEALREQLTAIVSAHAWQTQVPEAYLAQLGVAQPAS